MRKFDLSLRAPIGAKQSYKRVRLLRRSLCSLLDPASLKQLKGKLKSTLWVAMTTICFFIVFAPSRAHAEWFSETWPSVRQRIERLTPKDHGKGPVVLECSSLDEPVSPTIVLSPDVALKLSYPDERYLRACDPPEAPRYSIYYREGEMIVYSVYESQRSAVSGQQLDEIGQLTADGKPLTADGQQSAASGQQSAEENRLTVDSQPLTVLKEWIYTEEPNVPTGSKYSWNISGAENVEQDDQGRVHVSSQERSYIIDPVVYWTRDGVQHNADWQVGEDEGRGTKDVQRVRGEDGKASSSLRGREAAEANLYAYKIASPYRARNDDSNAGEDEVVVNVQPPTISSHATISFSIAAKGADYPLLIDPTLNYGQWLGGDNVGTVVTIRAVAYEGGNSEVYVGGHISGSHPNDDGITSYGTFDIGEGFVLEIADGGTPSVVWRQWLGGVSSDFLYALAVTGDEIYAGGSSSTSTNWESVTFQGAARANEGFVVEIGDGGTPTLVWGQWLGGTSGGSIYAIAVTGDEIYAAGYIPVSTSFEAVTMQGAHAFADGFVVEIGDGGTPTLVWGQWLGGNDSDFIYALAVTGDEIYAGGESYQSTSFEAVTFQGAFVGTEGFVVEIGDGGTPTLVWGQRLGGTNTDSVYALAVTGDEIYVAGYSTQSTSFEAVTFQGAHVALEGFVVEIGDGGSPTLVWGQRLGGSSNEYLRGIVVTGDEIYAAGYTSQSTSFEAVTFQGAHSGLDEGFVVEIGDGGTPTLVWGQWLGGNSTESLYALAVTGDAVYAGGSSFNSTSFEVAAFQGTHLGGPAGYVVEISDGGSPGLAWGHWFGTGQTVLSSDAIEAIAAQGQEIYVGGYSMVSSSFEAVTFQGASNGYDGFVIEIADGGTPSLVWGQWLGGINSDSVYAVAVTGDEIYAAGQVVESTSFESVVFQGAHAAGEGFVVEIGDGGTPTLVWGQWLGGASADIIYSLAVTGDEIYAAGESNQSTSFETVTFQGAHVTTEGFVVEIGDGGTPTLVWGQ